MHSIYWVPSRQCNQRCPHCYNDSSPDAPGLTMDEVDRCIDHMPDPREVRVNMVMLSGGEVLAWPKLLFHTLRRLDEHFGEQTELTLQTNGDMLDHHYLQKMLDHRVSSISIASNDPYHKRSTRERMGLVEQLLIDHGMVDKRAEGFNPDDAQWQPPDKRLLTYDIWGATEGSWIGPLWPRGRANQVGLSKARATDNFCGNWSGAIGFLDIHNDQTCQVAMQLDDVYPCCPMTCRPIGNLQHETLVDILDRCAKHPVYQALNEGRPEKMGQSMGLSEQHGIERTEALGNHCLWCDEFFTQHAPEMLYQSGRTERGTVDLLVNGQPA